MELSRAVPSSVARERSVGTGERFRAGWREYEVHKPAVLHAASPLEVAVGYKRRSRLCDAGDRELEKSRELTGRCVASDT